MRICIVGKYPPIEGGVSMHNYWIARSLARRGHEVHVITNADEVEPAFRIRLAREDEHWYEPRFEHGSVRVWNTERFGREFRYIPQANPFVTKLASLATDVVESSAADVILSYYFEPYAVAAHLASTWTGTPLIVRHAGSDVGRLLKLGSLRRCYVEILRRAQLVVTSEPRVELFLSVGVEPSRLHPNPGFSLPREYFNPHVEPLKLNSLLSDLAASQPDPVYSGQRWSCEPIDEPLPTIGLYGKIGESKGTFDLVSSLADLKRNGLRFNFIAITHGWPEREKQFRDAVVEANLEEETRILPFIPHWRIPSFLRSLTAACFLEQGFPIKSHSPTIPTEVLACGTCLIVSAEAACKQRFSQRLIHGINALIVRDPRNHAELTSALRQVIADPEFAYHIGSKGALLTERFQNHSACVDRHESMLRQALADASGLPKDFIDVGAAGQRYQGALWTYFPLTTKLLGSRIESVTERLSSTATKRHENQTYIKALDICEAISEVIAEDQVSPDCPTLVDVMLWELYGVPMIGPQLPKIAEDMLFRSEQIDTEELTPDTVLHLVPLKMENTLVREFCHDMEKLVPWLREQAISTKSGRDADGPVLYLFQSLPGRPRARVSRLTPELALVLELCDGRRSVRKIAAEAAHRIVRNRLSLQGSLLNQCAKAVIRLWHEGLVRFLSVT